MKMRWMIFPVLLVLCQVFLVQGAYAQAVDAEAYKNVKPYYAPVADLLAVKGIVDDPRPFYTDSNFYKKFIPDDVWPLLTFDEEKSRQAWEKLVGFKSPDLTGKVAPEIKPGKYTLEDKEKYPFKELMQEKLYNAWNEPGTEGQPRHAAFFTEFEVVPTQQVWWAQPVGEKSLEYMGQTKQDEQGYIISESYKGGIPFPRPSGEHMGLQLMYNWMKRKFNADNMIQYDLTVGVNRSFDQDHTGIADYYWLRLEGRVMYPPYGWYDARAEKMKEELVQTYYVTQPRDLFGNVYYILFYGDSRKDPTFMAYVNLLRRVRKLSSSDRQDQAVGQDICFDDADGFAQALNPDRYPYDFQVEEVEMLTPAYTTEGTSCFDSKEKYKWKNLKFERRPMYKVTMTQKDPNYIYSKQDRLHRRESFLLTASDLYDQKGRYYRNFYNLWGFVKPMGYFNYFNAFTNDYIDEHSTLTIGYGYPALWLTRQDMSLRSMMKAK